jgi:hypothetical protein
LKKGTWKRSGSSLLENEKQLLSFHSKNGTKIVDFLAQPPHVAAETGERIVQAEIPTWNDTMEKRR